MRSLTTQFVRFSLVGAIGFLIDAGMLYLMLRGLGWDLYSGRLASFLTAASVTWALNRRFTFAQAGKARAGRQWARFVAVNGIGGAVNYAVYAALVASVPTIAAMPVLGVAAGSVAGLAVNFTASRRLVFNRA